jgi:hypothetical protein
MLLFYNVFMIVVVMAAAIFAYGYIVGTGRL